MRIRLGLGVGLLWALAGATPSHAQEHPAERVEAPEPVQAAGSTARIEQEPELEQAEAAPSLETATDAPESGPESAPGPAPALAPVESPAAPTAQVVHPWAEEYERPPADGASRKPLDQRGYARPIIIADAAAGGLVLGGTLVLLVCALRSLGNSGNHDPEDDALCLVSFGAMAAGVGTFLLASPIIHIAHGHPEMALASLGLRVALPTLGVLATRQLDGGLAGGYLVLGGIAAAVLLDWFVLAQDEPSEGPPSRSITAAPWLAPNAAGLVLSGRL